MSSIRVSMAIWLATALMMMSSSCRSRTPSPPTSALEDSALSTPTDAGHDGVEVKDCDPLPVAGTACERTQMCPIPDSTDQYMLCDGGKWRRITEFPLRH